MDKYMGNHPIRRIRIQGEKGKTQGYFINVYDIDTGEAIANIKNIMVNLSHKGMNTATITYYAVNEHGNIIKGEDDGPIENVAILDHPCIDITALG